MTKAITIGMEINVSNARCVGIKIEDNSYVGTVTKVNTKSFILNNGGKFTFKKITSDGQRVYKNGLGHIVVL